MRPPRHLAALAALGLAVLLALVLTRSTRESALAAGPAQPARGADEIAREPAPLAAPDAPSGASGTGASPSLGSREALARETVGAAPADSAAVLVVEVVALETGVPLAGVELALAGASPGAPGASLSSDGQGRAEFAVRP